MAYTTLAEVYQNARFRTGTSTSDFADSSAALLSLTNKYYRRVVSELVDLNEDFFATIALASMSSGVNSYTLNQDSTVFGGGNIKVLRLEMTYDSTNWSVATPLDFEQISTATNLTDVNAQFSTSQPFYAIYGNTLRIFPFPTSDVASGMRIFEVQRQREVSNASNAFMDATSSTLSIQLPKEFMEPMEDFLTGDMYERIGKTQEAIATRQSGEVRLAQLKKQFARRNEDFDLSVTTNATTDYGE